MTIIRPQQVREDIYMLKKHGAKRGMAAGLCVSLQMWGSRENKCLLSYQWSPYNEHGPLWRVRGVLSKPPTEEEIIEISKECR